MLSAVPPQGTNAVPSKRVEGADLGSAALSNERDGDRLLARRELRRILRDRRASHAARVSAARALGEMAARERSVESGWAFRERLAFLETVPLEHRLELLRGILMNDGLEHAPAVSDAALMPDPD
jgi:hypothetical protein